jgi:hypothetical protein
MITNPQKNYSDEAQAKIIALREKAEKEQQSYIQEMKELDRTLEQDRKLKEFMATKISDRSEKGDSNRGNETKPLGEYFRAKRVSRVKFNIVILKQKKIKITSSNRLRTKYWRNRLNLMKRLLKKSERSQTSQILEKLLKSSRK